MDAPRRMVISGALWTAVLFMALARTFGNIESLTVWTIVVGQVAMCSTIWLIGQDLLERYRLVARSDTKRLLEKHRDEMIRLATDLAAEYNMDAREVARVLAETLLEEESTRPTLSRV